MKLKRDNNFIGREKELESLHILLKKRSSSLVVIRGRRRVGKSRLIQEFCKGKKHLIFEGLPPVKTTKKRQINEFIAQLSKNLKIPRIQSDEWSQCFEFLAAQTKQEKIVIVFDEISWMGSKDPQFLGYLKNAWDYHFSLNPNLILIVCGSVSDWIEENILSNTGFVGRISIDLVLEELSIAESQEFWGKRKTQISSYEKFKILSVTGGIPKYLEEVIPEQTAEENIQRLCFQSKGLLYREYDQIFSELFSKRSITYSSLIRTLNKASLTLDEICSILKVEKSGSVSKCLKHLMLAGFLAEDKTWDLKTQKTSKLKKFRIKDNYIRFYLRYIEPNKEKISKDLLKIGPSFSLPGWETIMGLQFENLVTNNTKSLCDILKIDTQDIEAIGPFFQRATQRKKGCQIDLLIQTKYNNLYVCEIKFSKEKINNLVVKEIEEKIKNLSVPKNYSIRPVLIHVNGVSSGVVESETFSHIVDFSDFLSH